MPESAEAHSVHLESNRNVTIEIINLSPNFCLTNPKVYMNMGFPFSPPQPTVRKEKTEVCSFIKKDNTFTGTSGVFTYQLLDMTSRRCKEVVAIMFSVPYDYNLFKNCLAIGIFDKEKACDETLYEEMCEGKDFTNFSRHDADGSGVKFAGKMVDVRGCMSDEGRAIIKLEVFNHMG